MTIPPGHSTLAEMTAPVGLKARGDPGQSGQRRDAPRVNTFRNGQKHTQYILYSKTDAIAPHCVMKKQHRKCL